MGIPTTATPDTSQTPPTDAVVRRSTADYVVLAAATLAALIAGYLTYQSVVRGVLPAGCGSGSGCGEVLSSKYAQVAGVPVSALALVSYVALIAAFVAARFRGTRVAWGVVATFAVAILGAAAWFVYLQVSVLRAICPWCMTDHALGALAAIAALAAAGRARGRRTLPAAAVGLAAVVGLAVVQANSTAPVQTLSGVQVSLLDGQFAMAVEDEPHFGPADAPAKLFVLFDYACPHCRAAHDRLKEIQATRPDLLLVLLPATIERRCNPAFTNVPDRFNGSCEVAELALAVHVADPAKFAEFDQWLYDWPAYDPRPLDAARAEAERLVGADALRRTLETGEPRKRLQRNIDLMTATTADHVPVLIAPGHPPVMGKIESEEQIRHLLAPASKE